MPGTVYFSHNLIVLSLFTLFLVFLLTVDLDCTEKSIPIILIQHNSGLLCFEVICLAPTVPSALKKLHACDVSCQLGAN